MGHAQIIQELGLCLEEYIEFLKLIEKQYNKSYKCAMKIKKFLKKQYDYDVEDVYNGLMRQGADICLKTLGKIIEL